MTEQRLFVAQRIAHQFGRDVHDLNHAVVRHACGPDHPQSTHHMAIDFVIGADHREFFEGHHLTFAANVNAHTFGLMGHVEQTNELGLLFEQIERSSQLSHVAGEVADREQIALAAGDLIMQVYRQDFSVDFKADQSPLTEADTQASALILAQLKTIASDVSILSEESSEYFDLNSIEIIFFIIKINPVSAAPIKIILPVFFCI